jgi:hypothetical protein
MASQALRKTSEEVYDIGRYQNCLHQNATELGWREAQTTARNALMSIHRLLASS